MNWMLPAIAGMIFGNTVLALVYMHLYFHNRERCFALWTAGWGTGSVRFIFAIALALGVQSPLVIIVIQTAALVSGFLLLWGTYLFTGGKVWKGWFPVVAGGFAWIIFAAFSHQPFILLTLPTFTLLGTVYIWTGIQFLRSKQSGGIGKYITGWSFILWGLHKIDYPFLFPVRWFAPWGFLLGTVLELSVAVGILLVYFQRVRSEMVAKDEHIRQITDVAKDTSTKYKVLFENSNDSVVLGEMKPDNRLGRILEVNNETCSRLGYLREELLTMAAESVLGSRAGIDEGSFQRLLSGSSISFDGIQVTKSGRMISVENTAQCVILEGRNVLLINSHNVSWRKKVEEDLREKEERLRRISDGVFEGISISENGRVIDANSRMAEMLGYELGDLIGRKVTDMIAPASRDQVTRRMKDGYQGVYEHEALRKDGSIISVEGRGNETIYRGRPVRITTIRDITERKRAEEKIRAALGEKEVLLKEIRHRVKTNLQGVLGLLNIQAGAIGNDEARRAFRESQNRILTMALIHEKLYEMDDLSRIDFEEFTGNLISHLSSTYLALERNVRIDYSAPGVRLNVDTAVPCGLIINELVTNALEHAFVDRKKGKILVNLTRNGSDRFVLTVSDDGIELPEDALTPGQGHLGLTLVNSFTDQLSGSMSVDRKNGTSFKIEFAEYHEAGVELY